MESFEEIVNGVRNSVLVGSCAECTYGTSKAGQRFAILITKVASRANYVLYLETKEKCFCNLNRVFGTLCVC